jgi:hypothetical protein
MEEYDKLNKDIEQNFKDIQEILQRMKDLLTNLETED